MGFYKKALFAVVWLALSAAAIAEQRLSLTLEDAIQIGLDKSRAIHASLMKVQFADSKSSEANALLLPSVKFAGAYARLSDIPPTQVSLAPLLPQPITLSPSVLNNYNLRFTVQQPIFTGFKLQRNADIAEYTANATQHDFERDKSDLIFDIKSAYWNLSQALELQKVVDESVAQMAAHLKDVQSWQGQGMLTINDVLKVQVQLSDAQLRQIDSRSNVQLARIGFNSLLGLPLDTEVDPTTSIKHNPKTFGDLPDLVRGTRQQFLSEFHPRALDFLA